MYYTGIPTPAGTWPLGTWPQMDVAVLVQREGWGHGYPHWKSPEHKPPSPPNPLYIIKTYPEAQEDRTNY